MYGHNRPTSIYVKNNIHPQSNPIPKTVHETTTGYTISKNKIIENRDNNEEQKLK